MMKLSSFGQLLFKCQAGSVFKKQHVNCRHFGVEPELEDGKKRRPHTPVMAKEVIQMLNPSDEQVFIDMTFGAGGHSEQILNSAKNVTILAVDRDITACNYAQKLAENYKGRVIPMLGKFSELESMLNQCRIGKESVDGVLFDVGASSMQMDDSKRGFALSADGPLDMRMDINRESDQPSARDVVNTLDSNSLAKIFKVYGDEKSARQIAEAITEARFMLMELNTTKELATLVENVIERPSYADKLGRPAHVATKIFQALRIFVNDELNELDCGLELAYDYVRPGGKLVAISFHSLEDRIIKRHMMGIDVNDEICSSVSLRHKSLNVTNTKEDIDALFNKRWTPINKKVITPSEQELLENPRSRSAKLRAAIKN